jgi:hypothetical protein
LLDSPARPTANKLDYELVSFFPEEFIDSLLNNGHLNGHELPQKRERQTEDAMLKEDNAIADEKERLARLIADGQFMQGRAQWTAAIQLYKESVKLAEKIDPSKIEELKKKIAFFEERLNDPSMDNMRAYGWERRAELEDLHLGIRIGDTYSGGTRNYSNSIKPKYGIVNYCIPTELKVCRKELAHYGAVIIVYRDELRWRSSYSYGDSTVLKKDENTGLVKGPELFAMADFKANNSPTDSVQFVEVQVWGPIDLADIKEFRVPEGRTDLVKELSKSGLPVSFYNRKQLSDEPAFVNANELGISAKKKAYKGDNQLMQDYEKLRLKRISQP